MPRILTRNQPNSVKFIKASSQYGEIAGDASFQTDIQSEFSVSLDVKINATVLGSPGFMGSSGSVSNRNFTFHLNAGAQLVVRLCEYGVTSQTFNTGFVPTLGKWYRFGVSYKDGDHVRIFANESLLLEDLTPAISASFIVQPLGISGLSPGGNLLDCNISSLQIFSGSINNIQEWQQWYFSQVQPSGLTAVVDLDFDEGSGSTVADSTANGNDMTLASSPAWESVAHFQLRDSVGTARSAASTRTAVGSYRIPYRLKELGVTNYWDWRTGQEGINAASVNDLFGSLDGQFSGGSALGDVFTAGEYSATFNPTLNDTFRTRQDWFSPSAITAVSFLSWMNIDNLSSSKRTGIAQWDSDQVPTQRAFILRTDLSGKIEFLISSTGTNQYTWVTDDVVMSTGTWQPVVVTFDGSQSSGDRVIVYVDDNTPLAGSGLDAASIYNANASVVLGAFLSAGGSPASKMDGKLGVSAMAVGRVWTAAEVQEMIDLTNSLAGYI